MADNDALVSVFLSQRAALVDAAAPIVGCRSRAEDVVQDAYVRLAEGGAATDVRHPPAYLFRLVRNLAVDRLRRSALEARHGAGEAVPESAAAVEPSPEDAALARESLRRLEAALTELPERTRLVFEMSRVGGLTSEQIAARLGISVSLVYLLLRDAMTHCRQRLFGGTPE